MLYLNIIISINSNYKRKRLKNKKLNIFNSTCLKYFLCFKTYFYKKIFNRLCVKKYICFYRKNKKKDCAIQEQTAEQKAIREMSLIGNLNSTLA